MCYEIILKIHDGHHRAHSKFRNAEQVRHLSRQRRLVTWVRSMHVAPLSLIFRLSTRGRLEDLEFRR